MNIAFEVQLFLKGNKTGIAWCADNLIREIAKRKDCTCQFDYFTLGYKKEQEARLKEYQEYSIKNNACRWFHNVLYKSIWPWLPLCYQLFFPTEREITQFFNFVVPPGVKGKTVTIVHDMAYMAYPQTVANKTRKWLQLTMKQSCKRADKIITVSEFSKQEIIKYLHIEASKITVMPNGVDHKFFYPRSLQQINKVKEKFHIKQEYFLYLGTLEPRKNIERLIKAYSELLRKSYSSQIPQLVLAGGKGWMYESIFLIVQELKLEEKVVFTDYIENEEVPVLMSGAKAFVFPSLYEGFGMPPLEAMACGTPVITSNVSALPEIGKDAAILINPYSIEEITQAMQRILQEKSLKEELVQAGIKKAKTYTWASAAEILIQVYQELLSLK